MKLLKRGGALLSGLIVGLTLHSGSARANVVYDWSGTCTTFCSGTATAVLTLADTYTLGTALAFSDFISFSFSASNLTYNIPGDNTVADVSGTLPNGTSSTAIIDLDWTTGVGTFFVTNGGGWTSTNGGPLSGGLAYQWSLRQPAPVSAVPLPAPFLLLATALGALGLGGWWRKRAAVAA